MKDPLRAICLALDKDLADVFRDVPEASEPQKLNLGGMFLGIEDVEMSWSREAIDVTSFGDTARQLVPGPAQLRLRLTCTGLLRDPVTLMDGPLPLEIDLPNGLVLRALLLVTGVSFEGNIYGTPRYVVDAVSVGEATISGEPVRPQERDDEPTPSRAIALPGIDNS